MFFIIGDEPSVVGNGGAVVSHLPLCDCRSRHLYYAIVVGQRSNLSSLWVSVSSPAHVVSAGREESLCLTGFQHVSWHRWGIYSSDNVWYKNIEQLHVNNGHIIGKQILFSGINWSLSRLF